MILRHFPTPWLFFVSLSVLCAQTPIATPAPTATGTNAKPAGTPPIVLHLPRLIPVTEGTVVPLWPAGKMPGLGADEPESQTTSGNPSPDGNIILTNVSNPVMTVYKAPGVTGPAPNGNTRVCLLSKAITTVAVSMKITRKDKQVIPVSWDARKLSGTPLLTITDVGTGYENS